MATSSVDGARPGVSRASVEHRLITMRKSVGQLDSLGALSGARLAGEPGTGLAVERVLALLNDLAFAVNRHLCAALLGEEPRTPGASFGEAGRAGVIDVGLVEALAPPEGPHHVLVQLYLDTEPEEAAAVVSAARDVYREYVRQVADWINAPE
ncbi:hypothetical protein ACIRJS_27025 [Streptomyces sp. NPDC102340]|uniref:hypothetical protein n=1 Tax=unclassified Streptomyces TaxID=2593676 RepID=UPI0037F5EC60